MDEQGCCTCKYCGKTVNEDYNYTLDHNVGIYGEDKDPTIVREGVFCSRSCLIRWLLDPEAGEDKAGIGTSGRDALGLIFEVQHSLDEIVMGLYNEEDALVEVGLHDSRRDLEELRSLIVKPDAGEEAEG